MESFKVYLPSNACQFIYPNNTSSDYKTRLDRRIELDGQWEVGVESIYYSSKIKDKNEKVEIDCIVQLQKDVSVNEGKRFKYLLNSNGKWKGIDGIIPTKFEEDPNNLDGVIDTLNSMNKLMFNAQGAAFFFSKSSFTKLPSMKHFHIKISSRLMEVIGFKHNLIFGSKDAITQRKYMKIGGEKLTQGDYLMQYFDADVQQREARIILKHEGENFNGGEEEFLKLWNERVEILRGHIVIRFYKKMLIFDNYSNMAIGFSSDLAAAIGQEFPIFGRSTTWANYASKLGKGQKSKLWYIDVYSTELKMLTKEENLRCLIDVFPWHHKNKEEVMNTINEKVNDTLKEKLTTSYDSEDHKFQLTLNKSGYSNLILGQKLKVKFGKTLYFLFGLQEELLQGSEINGMRRIKNLIKHEQQLFILSNLANSISYASHQLQILQSFLHDDKHPTLVEHHFEPIMYLPLKSNNIDMIHLQLVNEDFMPVKIKNLKTLVCLYFRKSEKRL